MFFVEYTALDIDLNASVSMMFCSFFPTTLAISLFMAFGRDVVSEASRL